MNKEFFSLGPGGLTLTAAVAALLCSGAAVAGISGGVTATALMAEGGRANAVGGASLDLVLERPTGPGTLLLNIEGNTAVLPGSVPQVFAGADANAGTAQLNGSNGMVQISELKYRWDPAPRHALTAGLLDTAAYMDLAATANDEKSQFLNAALVNNLSIAFPDYTLGLVWEQGEAETQWFAMLTGSHGIGDNPHQSYGELLELDADGKRAFAAAGVRGKGGLLAAEAGVWGSNAEHTSLDGRDKGAGNYGAYGILGGAWRGSAFDLRAGYANPAVTPAMAFFSASFGFELEEATLGVGWALTRLAPDAQAAGLGDAGVVEGYLRLPVAGVEVTFDLQYLENPGFDATVPASRVGGVRLRYAF